MNTMDKKQAGDFLGVGIRAVERYQQQGKLTPKYEKGKTSNKVVYDADEVKRLKADIDAPQEIIDISPNQTPTETPSALAKRSDMLPALNALVELIQGKAGEQGKGQAVPIESKPLLKLNEAQALTGLSRQTLKDAIEKKKLKARVEGKAYRISRKALDEYITKTF